MNVTSPMWFALPPETHSMLLSTGTGPGPLLVAAEAWRTRAAQYANAAMELTALLATTQDSAWEGPSTERFVAAHLPFLHWLDEASAVATATATKHESTAAGYVSALGNMPTLATLAANHALHASLVVTNFFGTNTIPIAANETDYQRMWIQAATTMTMYQTAWEKSLAATPTTSPPPRIVNSTASAATASTGSGFPDPTKLILQLLKDLLDFLRTLAADLPGPLGNLITQVLNSLISFVSSQIFTILAYSTLDPMIYFGPFTPLASPFFLPSLAGLTGLVGVCVLPKDAEPQVAGVQSDEPGQRSWPATAAVMPASTTTTASISSPATTTAVSAAPTSQSVPNFDASQGIYAASGPDGEGFTPTARSKATTGITLGAAAPTVTLHNDQSQASTKKATKARVHSRQYRFEFLADNERTAMSAVPVAEQVTASDRNSESLGFSGTIAKSAAGQAKGITQLGGDEFVDAPHAPMLPHTWTDKSPA